MVNSDAANPSATILAKRHLQFGWWSLLLFLSVGVFLEYLLGYKVVWYNSDEYETRRLMWRLAHAHGTLLSVVHITFGITMFLVPNLRSSWRKFSSACLMAASVLLPGGFFAAGIFFFDGDPGYGIFLVPVGALLLFIGVLLTALGLSSKETLDEPD